MLSRCPFFLAILFSFVTAPGRLVAEEANTPRPRLTIINGAGDPIEVFWIKDDGSKVSNGIIPPGRENTITTTIGHRFEIVSSAETSPVALEATSMIQGYRFDPGSPDGIPAVYTQVVYAEGFPIVATEKVNPYAIKEAAWLVNQMLANRPDVRAAMIKSGARMCIMAYNEYTTDLPEFARLKPKEYWDARARGLGGSETDPYCSCAEENLLAYPGDPYSTECILIHEFAHNIHLRGMLNVDPTFDKRLRET